MGEALVIMQKQSDEDYLTPDEEKAIEQHESDNEKLKSYKTPQDLIEDLHNSE